MRGCVCCPRIRTRWPRRGVDFGSRAGSPIASTRSCCAKLARTDHHRFRVLEPDSDQSTALRALTRGREDLVGTRTALTNQLRAELERFWPGPLHLFSELHSRISLAFLERYPSPADAHGLGEARLAAFLARERYSGRQTPMQLLAKLRRAPAGRVGELELSTRRQLVLSLVATINSVNVQIKDLERPIAAAVRRHPDGAIFLSLFKGSVIIAAELPEMGDCRARYPNRDPLAGDAGHAAVAIESGKRKAACFRWGCNKRLRSAFCTLADSSRHWHPWAQDLYAAAHARNHDHPRALRTVGRAWCRTVFGAVGKTVFSMTPLATAHCNDTSPSPFPHRRAQGPTSLPPSGSRAPLSPQGGPQGPSAKRLRASRHPLSTAGELTQGVCLVDLRRTRPLSGLQSRANLVSSGGQAAVNVARPTTNSPCWGRPEPRGRAT